MGRKPDLVSSRKSYVFFYPQCPVYRIKADMEKAHNRCLLSKAERCALTEAEGICSTREAARGKMTHWRSPGYIQVTHMQSEEGSCKAVQGDLCVSYPGNGQMEIG